MVNANAKTVMEVWQEIRKDRERGALCQKSLDPFILLVEMCEPT